MKIGLNVFSCSRFRELQLSLASYREFLSKDTWKYGYLHEDKFKEGLHEIEEVKYFTVVEITTPCFGLGHAFCRAYTNGLVQENDYNVHLEDDWVLQGECCEKEVAQLMQEHNLLQVYIVSKKTLEQGIKRTKREPDYYLDGKRLGLFIGQAKMDRMGHMVPNTTPHIGAKGLFDPFLNKLERSVQKNKKEINPYKEAKSPCMAWKMWQRGLPPYQFNRFRYGFLVQREIPLIKHIGTKTRHRIKNKDNKPIMKSKQ